MSIQYEVTAITGKYTDRDGKEKSRYAKLGVVMNTKNGPMLKLESVPVGWDGWAYLNEPKAAEDSTRGNSSSGRRQAPQPVTDGFEDSEIPFITNRGLY